MPGARHFTELECWKLADQLKVTLYALGERPKVRRDPAFRDQLRDAAATAPRTIAEGFGRRSHKDFARFLDMARGSLNECQAHIKDARDRGYASTEDFEQLWQLSARALAATAGLQRYLRGRS